MSLAPIQPKKKRGRGRPRKFDSVVIKSENAKFKTMEEFIDLLPRAVEVLKNTLETGSEKGKETAARFIITNCDKIHDYLEATEAEFAEQIQREETEAAKTSDEDNEEMGGIVVNFGG